MSFITRLQRAREILEQQGRLSTRALVLEIGDEELDELIEELVDVQQVARREGKILVWAGASAPPPFDTRAGATRTPPPIHRAADQVETRKVISIIFADLMGSTALQEGLDPESVNRVMDAYYQSVRGPVEAAGGTVVQLLGDGVLCAFGIPRIAEDDALRAVRAAVGIQQAFREFLATQQWLRVPIGLRVAVNTGEVVVSEEHPAGIGDPLNVAARLQQEARDGEVVIGQATRRLVADAVTLEQAGVFALKGRAETVTAYRVVSLERPTGATTAAFVGRDEELARITAVYEAARATPAARLAVVVGSPGLGKSRLIAEVARRLGDTASVVTAQCDAAGAATFAPVAEALRAWLGVARPDRTDPSDPTDRSDLHSAIVAALPDDTPDRDRIIAGITALLAGSPASPEETFFVIRRFLTALAQNKPVVLVIDDLHWAEPLLLDLVEHLVQWGSGVPLFVLVGGRPELRDLRSSLATPGGFVSDVVTLSGLDAGAAMRLAANVIGASDLPAAVAAKVLATSEGNPLFVGELVRMLVDEGAIERQGERWVVGANLAALEMPPTIHALLAARIERLRPDDRTVLERAAVVGRHFSRGAVAALLSRNGTELDARLEALRRTELIEPDTGWFLGEQVLRFHHVLIRDAAYRRLLKGTRAELHAKLADWIEAQVGDAAEHDETIGWHLEQAHLFLRELGPVDANGRTLGERAARHLAAAGRRALARDDLPVAANLLGRAIDRLDPTDSARADLALDWCEALLAAGDVGPAANAIAELGRFAGTNDRSDRSDPSDRSDSPGARLRAWHTCFASQLTVLTAPQGLQAAADAVAEAARQLAAQGDAAGEAKAHSVHAQALARLGKVGAAEAALDQALAAARKAGDRRRANAVLAGAPLAALWGPSPVTRASGRCLDVVRVLRITQGAPAVESVALSCQGVLEALRGRTEAARRMLASARKMVEELGIANRLFEADAFAGRIAMMEGDSAAAERLLRGAYEGLRDLGLGIDAARAGTLLARTLLAQDRVAEAEALSHESEQLAGDDLQAAIAWRGVRAEALAKRGEHGAAVELAKAAVAIASSTDALLDHADARVALAAALRAAGRGAEADAEERRAIDLWEAKGATLLVERARTKTHPIEPVAAKPAPRIEPAIRRRVRANAAAQNGARIAAAIAAGDIGAVERELADSVLALHHPTGSAYGRSEGLQTYRSLFQTEGWTIQYETLATLGDSLALSRQLVAIGSVNDENWSVGAAEVENLILEEVDGTGRRNRSEIFALDHLGAAIARLYARYAELLPEGPERERAAVTGRAVAYILTDSTIADETLLFDPRYEDIDHRHVGYGTLSTEAAQKLVVSQRTLADDLRFRVEEVLALRSDGLVRKTTTSGVWRDGGGAFERTVCMLSVFGPDGRATRQETFDSDREAEALARFDALADRGSLPISMEETPARRRVRPNAATAMQARLDAALAVRDFDGVAAVFHEDHQEIDHPTGSSYGREAAVASLRRLFRSHDPHYQAEPLATLGELLLLVRRRSGALGTASAHYDVGAYENEAIQLFEVDARGLCRRAEVFADNQLGNAIVRLYERYAELLPEGPARIRATGVARSVAVWHGPIDVDRLATVHPPSSRIVDHRFLETWSARDAAEILGHFRLQHDLAPDFAARYEDVFAVAADALVVHMTFFGTARDSGGPFENRLCALLTFGADGRITESNVFEPEQVGEALARFDELVGAAEAKRPARRRVRANAATRGLERFESALRARDVTALKDVFHESLQVVHHSTRATYGRREMLGAWRSVIKAERFDFRSEILASLGGALALEQHFLALEGLSEDDVPGIGRAEFDEIALVEADDHGRWLHCEIFAAERAGDAIARLYERHAALLPEGPGRERAVTTAHAAAAMLTRSLEHRLEDFTVSDLQVVDHRTVGTVSGRDVVSRWREVSDELTQDQAFRVEEVLALSAHGLLRRTMQSGTVRASGGAFETSSLALSVFGHDGRLTRFEIFEIRHEAEALARFDALVGDDEVDSEIASFDNAASRADQRLFDCFNARDWAGIEALAAPEVVFDERRRMLRNTCGREGWLEQLRVLFDVPASHFTTRLRATRGERFALSLHSFRGEVGDGGGPLALEGHLALHEVDGGGRVIAIVLFDLEDEDGAVAELDARYYAGEGASYPVHGAVMRAFTRAVVSRDWDPVLALCAPEFIEHDHRSLAVLGTTRGAAAWVQNFGTLVDLAPDTVYRVDHLRSAARGFRSVGTWVGSRDGGRYEIPLIAILELDDRDRLARADIYDPDQIDQALARFDELKAAPPPSTFTNAATASAAPVIRSLIAHDWEGFRQLFAEDFHMSDRRRVVQLELDRDQYVAFTREVADGRTIRNRWEMVATRGDRLAVTRSFYELTDADIGPSEIAFLILMELDERGRIVANVRWDLDDVDAAYSELDVRWARGEAADHPAASKWLASYLRFFAARDWSAMSALFTTEVIGENHRLVGWGTRRGPAGIVSTLQAQIELAPDTHERVDHVRTCERGAFFEYAWHGTHEGGAFENLWIVLIELNAEGRARRADVWEPEQLEEARARFEEIEGHRPPAAIATGSAATAWLDNMRVFDSGDVAEADWNALRASCAPGMIFEDRQGFARLSGDRELMIASLRERVASGARTERQLLGTAGARVAIMRMLWAGGPADGRFETEYLSVVEIDASGLVAAIILFSANDARAARREAWARWAAIDPVAAPWVELMTDFTDAWNSRDLSRIRAIFADDVVLEDHRHAGPGRIQGMEAWGESTVVLWTLAPDQRMELGWSWPAVGRHGFVVAARRVGTLADSGAFESELLWLGLAHGGRLTRVELFEPEDLDAALARFAEL